LTSRRIRHAVLFAAAAAAGPLGASEPALAQGKLDARYDFTLAGVSVGRGSWVIDIGDDQFSAAASGQTGGMMRILSSGRGQANARGAIEDGQFVPGSYRLNVHTDRRYDDVRMTISNGAVRDFSVEPKVPPAPNRVPLTEAHRRGVADPLSASLIRVPGTGNLFSAEACPRKIAVFDGRMRYDLHLGFKRIEQVKTEKGYQGKAVVCSVVFAPIAGHATDRVQYLANQREIEALLAPIAGTRVMAPYRVTVPTPLGTGVMQATQFISIPQPTRASALSKPGDASPARN
jgi:hypothetical protein